MKPIRLDLAATTMIAAGCLLLGGLQLHHAGHAHAATVHFVHFATTAGADVWVAPQGVEAVDVAQNGYSYQTRISTSNHTYFVSGTVAAAEAALAAALP